MRGPKPAVLELQEGKREALEALVYNNDKKTTNRANRMNDYFGRRREE
jgi:hypothetical protein